MALPIPQKRENPLFIENKGFKKMVATGGIEPPTKGL
jgi:hypothetical protein